MTKKNLISLASASLIFLAACSTPDAPPATVTLEDIIVVDPTAETGPNPTSMPAPAAPTAVPVPANTASPDDNLTHNAEDLPPESLTGIYDVDLVTGALLADDKETIARFIQFRDVACTTAGGLGGPPKCPEGSADGSPVTVFPILGPEGAFVSPDGLDQLVEGLEIGELFGVYQVPLDKEDLDYWPAGTYGIVTTGTGNVRAYTFVLDRGQIVRLIYHFDETTAEAFDNERGAVILAPMQ